LERSAPVRAPSSALMLQHVHGCKARSRAGENALMAPAARPIVRGASRLEDVTNRQAADFRDPKARARPSGPGARGPRQGGEWRPDLGWMAGRTGLEALRSRLRRAGCRASSRDLAQAERTLGGPCASAVHRETPRRKNPFVAVNCAAFSETLLESKLFGHVHGVHWRGLGGRDVGCRVTGPPPRPAGGDAGPRPAHARQWEVGPPHRRGAREVARLRSPRAPARTLKDTPGIP
jgi:hypothetical protein